MSNKKSLDYIHAYTKENYKAFRFLLDNEKDKFLISYLNSCKTKTQYIKSLLYKDLASQGIFPNTSQSDENTTDIGKPSLDGSKDQGYPDD